MTVFAKILLDRLKEKNVDACDVWYEPGFSWQPSTGWYFEDAAGNEYKLGKNRTEAMDSIITKTFKKIES